MTGYFKGMPLIIARLNTKVTALSKSYFEIVYSLFSQKSSAVSMKRHLISLAGVRGQNAPICHRVGRFSAKVMDRKLDTHF